MQAAIALTLTLTVNWGDVTLDQPYPVTGGIPLARGVLRDPNQVALFFGDTPIAVQTEALAYWPDGSVKWLLLDFQAIPGKQSEFRLEYGPGVLKPAFKPRWVMTTKGSPDAIEVDTGVVKFVVRKDGSGFIDELSYAGTKLADSRGKRLNVLDFLHAGGPADYHPMERLVKGESDPSKVVVTNVALEQKGPLRATVVIDGKYTFAKVGSTITGTDVKGDCPFRIRIHAYAGQSMLKVEHFFYYEGDGDRDFAKTLALKVGLPAISSPSPLGGEGRGEGSIRFIGDEVATVPGPLAGLYQQNADAYQTWTSGGDAAKPLAQGARFEGVLDVVKGNVGVAVGIKDFWRAAPKSLHADLSAGLVSINLYAPEAPPLDFRRHAREWSVGETGTPDDPKGVSPKPMTRDNYRLASKGVGKTHYALVYLHDANAKPEDIRAVYRLFNRRPLVFATPKHYADSLALGRYREYVAGVDEDVERATEMPVKYWMFSQDRFRWYGFWLYGNVCQSINHYFMNGRWSQEFGRWGWANGDSVGRLAYALMLQTVRRCTREDFEFAEAYLLNVHDVCSTHTPAYPHHGGESFNYVKGAAHRHGAWPWACPYVGARGAHPVGAKIYYFLTGEGHAKDILDEITQLALKNPNGGEGDGPLGPNAQIFLYQWEATGKDEWRVRVKKEIDSSEDLKNANSGWLCMMNAAFGIYNALEEYVELTGDKTYQKMMTDYADRSSPEQFKNHWTWGGYYRVYSSAYNVSGDVKYKGDIVEMLKVLVSKASGSVALKLPPEQWPGPAGGPESFTDGNIIRDVPFALYSLHAGDKP